MGMENVVVEVSRGGKRLEKFVANYPNLRSLKGFLAGEWNLALFDKCFKGNNRLGDIDASIELNGHTLLIEFKNGKNGMNRGQLLKAIRQAKHSNITTIFVFGKQDTPEGYLKIEPDAEQPKAFKNSGYMLASMDGLTDQFTRWAMKAEANNLVESKTAEWTEVNAILAELRTA